jgi:hypothetical protein
VQASLKIAKPILCARGPRRRLRKDPLLEKATQLVAEAQAIRSHYHHLARKLAELKKEARRARAMPFTKPTRNPGSLLASHNGHTP